MVWTLIESFAFAMRVKYRNNPFTEDFSYNQGSFNWNDYRLSRSVMQHIKSNATHWRATCNYNTHGLVKTDYVRGLLSDVDILTYGQGHKCVRMQYINILGKICESCTSHFRQDHTHAFIDSGYGHRSELGCEWDGRQDCPDGGCDYFGKYVISNPRFRCSNAESSTTQWWLGTVIFDQQYLQRRDRANP
jgi:hypothetical protein